MRLDLIKWVFDVRSPSMPPYILLSPFLLTKNCNFHSFLKTRVFLSHIYYLKTNILKIISASSSKIKPLVIPESVGVCVGEEDIGFRIWLRIFVSSEKVTGFKFAVELNALTCIKSVLNLSWFSFLCGLEYPIPISFLTNSFINECS